MADLPSAPFQTRPRASWQAVGSSWTSRCTSAAPRSVWQWTAPLSMDFCMRPPFSCLCVYSPWMCWSCLDWRGFRHTPISIKNTEYHGQPTHSSPSEQPPSETQTSWNSSQSTRNHLFYLRDGPFQQSSNIIKTGSYNMKSCQTPNNDTINGNVVL